MITFIGILNIITSTAILTIIILWDLNYRLLFIVKITMEVIIVKIPVEVIIIKIAMEVIIYS